MSVEMYFLIWWYVMVPERLFQFGLGQSKGQRLRAPKRDSSRDLFSSPKTALLILLPRLSVSSFDPSPKPPLFRRTPPALLPSTSASCLASQPLVYCPHRCPYVAIFLLIGRIRENLFLQRSVPSSKSLSGTQGFSRQMVKS